MHKLRSRPFKFSHSILGNALLVIIELVLLHAFVFSHLPQAASINIGIILLAAVIGSVMTIYLATEIIEEVRGALHMITLLCGIVLEFVLFFLFQYLFLMRVQPGSFPTLQLDPLSLMLHSVMVFVFNPLYLPATASGRALLLVQTFAALALVLFVLQNIGEFRKKSLDREG